MTTPMIIFDAGHGGHDSGAVAASGLMEKTVNLAAARMLAGLSTVPRGRSDGGLIRYDDVFVPLQTRAQIANTIGADLFVSIHANASTSLTAHGFEIWTSPGKTASDECATSIFEQLRAALPGRRARMDMTDGDVDYEAGFKVLTATRMPAVLVELGFLSNQEEAALLGSHQFLLDATLAIWRGVVEWLEERGAS